MDERKSLISTDDPEVLYLKNRDKRLAVVINHIGSIECNKHGDSFAFIVEEIVGQMLSNKVADVICDRLLQLCGGVLSVESLSAKSINDLRSIGISKAKSQYILLFAEAVKNHDIDLDELADLPDKKVMERLMSLRGIGSWTAKMYLLFVLNRPDVLPYEDGAFQQSFAWLYGCNHKPTREEMERKCKKWKPHSSLATRYLYRALDMGLTKKEFHLRSGIIDRKV